MKVYVVYDPLYEEVVSVHLTEDGANKKIEKLTESDKMGNKRDTYSFDYDEFEVEE